MSILLVLVALVALVFVGGAVIAVYFVMRGDSSGDRERLLQASSVRLAEHATDVAFFFRFEQQDATDAKALVERFHVQLSPSETRDAALELTRLVPSATHAYLGPCAWPPVKAYSPVTLGVIVGFRARTRASLDTVQDDRQLTALAATLRQVSALPGRSAAGRAPAGRRRQHGPRRAPPGGRGPGRAAGAPPLSSLSKAHARVRHAL
jgi:hypothetical protein